MRNKFYIPLCFILIASTLPACSGRSGSSTVSEKPAESGETPKEFILEEVLSDLSAYSYKGDYRELVSEAIPYYENAIARGDDRAVIYLGLYIAQSYLKIDVPDSTVYYLEYVTPLAEKNNDKDPFSVIYNTYGLYTLNYSLNYNKALDYFMQAMECADDIDNKRRYVVILNNLAHTNTLRADTAGLKYALEVHEKGKESENKFFIYAGALNSTAQYLLRKDYKTALRYIEEAVALSPEFEGKGEAYTLYADVLAALGRDKEAERYYRLALDTVPYEDASSVAGLCRSYGNYLMDKKLYAQAAEVYRRGIEISLQNGHYLYRHTLYLGLSEAYGKLGDKEGEINNFRIYHSLSDSIFNAEKERSLNEMWVKYETEKRQKELKDKELLLVKENRKVQVSVLIILLLLIAAGAFLLLYHRKNRMYEQLVRQHQDYLQREKRYRSVMIAGGPEGQKTHDSTDDGKRENLFRKIEGLMEDKKIYRDKEITVDKLAEELQSNRSYISAAINQYAGISFKNYINSLRIADAVSVLSDPADETPVKQLSDDLGFNNLTSFYRAFQKETGVPPSHYRREVIRMRKSDDKDEE